MAAHMVKNQVGTLRIANEQAEKAVAGIDQEAVPAEVEVEPSPCEPVTDEIDDLRTRQERGMIADGRPRGRLGQARKMAGTVPSPFVDESHGARYDSGCQ